MKKSMRGATHSCSSLELVPAAVDTPRSLAPDGRKHRGAADPCRRTWFHPGW